MEKTAGRCQKQIFLTKPAGHVAPADGIYGDIIDKHDSGNRADVDRRFKSGHVSPAHEDQMVQKQVQRSGMEWKRAKG